MNRMKTIAKWNPFKILLLNNAITVKNSVEIFNSTLDQTEKKESVNLKQSEQEKKKKKMNEKEGEKKTCELWDTFKTINSFCSFRRRGRQAKCF